MDQNYLIVASILEGRHFPSRPGCTLIVEAKFDGECMSTDPVPHTCSPNFNTELAWGVDRGGLHVHRLRRTPIKLQCTAVDNRTGKRESCGYLVLEIRSIRENVKGIKWQQLLNSKYYGTKPEIHMGLHLEKDVVESEASTSKKEEVGVRVVNADAARNATPAPPENRSDDAIPRLNVEGGFYQIGPEAAGTEMYRFCVTVSFAANLNQLVTGTDRASSKQRCHFVYYLLGNEVTTDAFDNLSNPKFPAERASLRISSNPASLQKYFRANPSLQMFLYRGDTVIGEATIPLDEFGSRLGSAVPNFPALVEGIFQLHPVPADDELSGRIRPEYRPVVGVHVEICEEEQMSTKDNHSEPDLEETSTVADAAPAATPPQDRSPRRARSLDRGIQSPRRKEMDHHLLGFSPPQRLSKRHDHVAGVPTQTGQKHRSTDADPKPLPSVEPETLVSEGMNHYCFTLDLRSIYLCPPCPKMQCYVRYHYPFFGTTTPFASEAWTELRPDAHVTVKGGFCSFNFASTADMLENAFKEFPLQVVIICNEGGEERLFGTADIELKSILACPTSTFVGESGKVGYRKILTSKVPIAISGGTTAGELLSVICLDDLGVTTLPAGTSGGLPQNSGNLPSKDDSSCKKVSKPSDEDIMSMVTELELWKEQQEILFRKQLKEKEDAHLKALTEEWKQHDIERERMLKRKLKEYQELEDRLKAALDDVEKREQTLAQREAEVAKQKSEFQNLKSRLQRETKDTITRSLSEYEHLLQLERKKVQEMENGNKKLKEQVSELERKVKEKDGALDAIKSSHRASLSTDMKLRVELDKLLAEKVDLLRDLHGALDQRQHFREKWHSVSQELNECQKKLQELQQDGSRAQRDEVEALYHRSKARLDQQQTSNSAPGDFVQATRPATQIRTAVSIAAADGDNGATRDRRSSETDSEPERRSARLPSAAWDQHVKRLIQERDTLLKTGVYTSDDRIITELNRHITEALAGKTSGDGTPGNKF